MANLQFEDMYRRFDTREKARRWVIDFEDSRVVRARVGALEMESSD